MQTILQVEDMHCDHCVQSIQNAVGEVAGVESVVADLESRKVTVQHASNTAKDALIEAIEDQGFTVTG